eukprot:COSAG02_NODE_46075_length_352_cov_0.533597_1_plen_82_part_01
MVLCAPFADGPSWATPLRSLLRGATVWVWGREGDAELAWAAALLPECKVVAQQPVEGDGCTRVGLRTACQRAGLRTVKSYCD